MAPERGQGGAALVRREWTRFVAVSLLLVLAVPTLEAHVQGARPVLQFGQYARTVTIDAGDIGLDATLTISQDPLRQIVKHEIDPSRGFYAVKHRTDASQAEDEMFAQWRFERLVEYRDQNVDGIFQSATDTAVRAWRFQHYRWERGPIQRAQVADVVGSDIVWEGNLTGGPDLRVEVVVAGKDFSDEGATVRPQDIVMYIDFKDMPERGLGSLYAIEATVTVPAAATLSLYEAENTSTALMADLGERRAVLVWGGAAVLDGREQSVDATIEDDRVGKDGNRTARLVLHLPTVDSSMRFVMVSGVEYLTEDRRAPVSWALVLVALVAAALGGGPAGHASQKGRKPRGR